MPLCNAKKTVLRQLPARIGPAALIVATGLVLGSCSDSLDPTDWYNEVVGAEEVPSSGEPVPGAEDGYPNLADVPEAPENVSTPEEIAVVAEALAADLANAQYTSDPQRVDDETAPLAMPEIPVEEVVEETEVELIEPGGEIEIADALTVEKPATEEVVEKEIVENAAGVATVEETAVTEVVVALAAGAEVVEAAVPEPAPVVESRLETETVRDDSGELVGTITRVVTAREVVVETPAAEASAGTLVTEAGAVDMDSVAEALAAPQQVEVVEEVAAVDDAVEVVAVEPVATEVPAASTTAATETGFAALLAASGPEAGSSVEPVVIAAAEPAPASQASFTDFAATHAQTLAAIIRFGHGSVAIGTAERDILRQLAAIHAERGGPIRLVGHASKPASGLESTTQILANFEISLDRATAVAEELILLGVPRTDVIVEAAGDSDAGSDAALDRRVDVYIGA